MAFRMSEQPRTIKIYNLLAGTNEFIGVPKVISTLPDIQSIDVTRYLSGISIEQCHIQEMLGAQYLSIRNSKNETLLRRKIGILPADFSIEIKGGIHANEGTIVITTQH